MRYESEYLAHKGTKGMRWGYTDGEENGKRKAGEGSSDVPDYYVPNIERRMIGDKEAWIDGKSGAIWYGSYDEVRKKKYEFDVKMAEGKRIKDKNIEEYNASFRKQIDDAVRAVTETANKITDLSKDAISNGKNFYLNYSEVIEWTSIRNYTIMVLKACVGEFDALKKHSLVLLRTKEERNRLAS